MFIVYDDKEGLVTNKLSAHAILNQVRCVHAAKIHLIFRKTKIFPLNLIKTVRFRGKIYNNSSKSYKNYMI